MKKYRLGEIAEVIGGVTFNKADIATSGIRILRGGNIQNGEICLKENDVYLPHIYKDNKNTILEGDTILVASTGSMEVLGKAATAFSSLGTYSRKLIKYSFLILLILVPLACFCIYSRNWEL